MEIQFSSQTIFVGKSSLNPSHFRKSPVQKWATKTDGDHMDVLAPESSNKGMSRKASKRVSCHQVAMVGPVRSLYLQFALQTWVPYVQLDLIGRWPDWPCLTLSSCSSTSTFHLVREAAKNSRLVISVQVAPNKFRAPSFYISHQLQVLKLLIQVYSYSE